MKEDLKIVASCTIIGASCGIMVAGIYILMDELGLIKVSQ